MELYTNMYIHKFLKRRTTSSDDSVSSKSSERIWWDKDVENVNFSTNWNNEGVEENRLSNGIFQLLDKKLSHSEKFVCIRHCIPDNSFNFLAKQYRDSQINPGFMSRSCRRDLLEK